MSKITGVFGRLSGALEVNDERDVRVRVERDVTFDRDTDGSWCVIIGRPDAGEDKIAAIVAADPQASRLLDVFATVLADPDAHAGKEHRIEPAAPAA